MKTVSAKQTIGEVLNVGGCEEISISDLAKKIIIEVKSKSKIIHTPYNIGYEHGFEDINRRIPDLTKIKDMVDWQPEQTINQIIQDSLVYLTRET
jgi:UDP-glucose 4-epimerase